MKNLTATLCLTLAVLLGSTGVSYGQNDPISDKQSAIQTSLDEIKKETLGKSVLEFNRFSTFEEIARTYQCEKYKSKDNSWFKNSTGDWITQHLQKKGY